MSEEGERSNQDAEVVAGFGDEWRRFDQRAMSEEELRRIFHDYFAIFPWERLPAGAAGADIGCGSGRWARFVVPRVGRLHCIDPSPEALDVARGNLADHPGVAFHCSGVADLPFDDGSLDFAYSLGVLHHVPDTAAAIRSVAAKLKPGAPFLVYLYYAFDNRPAWFRLIWRMSDLVRLGIARLPHSLRYAASQLIAALVYWPLARLGALCGSQGRAPANWPLAYYGDKPFYVMRNDALDRFGTRLEQRFSQADIRGMLEAAGFGDIRFSARAPFWCAVGFRRRAQP